MTTRVSGRGLSDLNGGLTGPQPGCGPDEAQFEEFYAAYARRVRALARRRLGDPQQAEDAVQETFLHAFRGLRGLDPTRPVWPWLARIATNVCVDMLRHRQVHPDHNCLDLDDFTDVVPARGVDPAARCIAAEDRRAIVTALGAVCQRQRRVLMLREVEGWHYEDIAALEGMTLDALKGALKRARQSFREAYAAVIDGSSGWARLLPVGVLRRWRNRLRVEINRFQQAIALPLWAAMEAGALVAVAGAVGMTAFGGGAPTDIETTPARPAAVHGAPGQSLRAARSALDTSSAPFANDRPAELHPIGVGVSSPSPTGNGPISARAGTRWNDQAPHNERLEVAVNATVPVIGSVDWGFLSTDPGCDDTRVRRTICDEYDRLP